MKELEEIVGTNLSHLPCLVHNELTLTESKSQPRSGRTSLSSQHSTGRVESKNKAKHTDGSLEKAMMFEYRESTSAKKPQQAYFKNSFKIQALRRRDLVESDIFGTGRSSSVPAAISQRCKNQFLNV